MNAKGLPPEQIVVSPVSTEGVTKFIKIVAVKFTLGQLLFGEAAVTV